ncbi:MAG: polyprenyl synthetase family protein [Alphaproteobacteria bacterium]|nr:polyprenyl synthetase family protein [Alphaproteobacteria bacterium]
MLLPRIEAGLTHALSAPRLAGSPPRLAAAARHAVFPGGGRVRPLLTLAAAAACGDDDPALAVAGATAVELIHCASLVHDDLPCFDDADLRRGRPSVHAAFGEQLALLAGDALIVHASDVIAEAAARHPSRGLAMIRALTRGVGMPDGIIGGQAWECESRVDRATYHDAKTGALFVAALQLGALSAGAAAEPWRPLGQHLGRAYQLADDLHDAIGGADAGKPVHQDERLDRPSAVRELGLSGAIAALDDQVEAAVDAIPDCPGRASFAALVFAVAERLRPAAAAPRPVGALG